MSLHKTKRTTALTVGAILSTVLAFVVVSSAAANTSPRHSQTHPLTVITWRAGAEGCSGGVCGQYLQISHSSTADNAWTEIRNGPGDANERWVSKYLGNSEYAFKNVHSRKCLTEFYPNSPGRHIIQRGCENYPTSRRWHEFHTPNLGYMLQPVATTDGLAACPNSQRWVVMGAPGSGMCFWH